MAHLVPCPGCRRHLRRLEATCPFCGTETARDLAEAPERPVPSARLSRAALLAFAASSFATTACGGRADESTTGDDGLVADGGPGGASAGTGGAPATGGQPGTGGVEQGTGGEFNVPPYGAPLPPDAGTVPDPEGTPDAGASSDAADAAGDADDDAWPTAPPYGIAPND
jgi:hypothetical protein